jgi:hypothetical protein
VDEPVNPPVAKAVDGDVTNAVGKPPEAAVFDVQEERMKLWATG